MCVKYHLTYHHAFKNEHSSYKALQELVIYGIARLPTCIPHCNKVVVLCVVSCSSC
uniref:Uncharacterized protein n=1 Tax=Aegilops tauschii subsp. strangulata TaxID=200361 RepID=A0A453JCA2_AEGTS